MLLRLLRYLSGAVRRLFDNLARRVVDLVGDTLGGLAGGRQTTHLASLGLWVLVQASWFIECLLVFRVFRTCGPGSDADAASGSA